MINHDLTKTHISSETWTSFGKISLPKKIILFIAEQTLSYNSITDWTINQLRGSRKESRLKDKIPKDFVTLWFIVLTTTSLTHRYTPAFHDLQVLIEQLMVVIILILQLDLIGGEWQLLIQAETTKQLIREKSLACIGKTRDGTQVLRRAFTTTSKDCRSARLIAIREALICAAGLGFHTVVILKSMYRSNNTGKTKCTDLGGLKLSQIIFIILYSSNSMLISILYASKFMFSDCRNLATMVAKQSPHIMM